MARRKRSKAGGGQNPAPQPEPEPASEKEALDRLTNIWWNVRRQTELDAAFDRTIAFIGKYPSPNVMETLATAGCLRKIAWQEFKDTLVPHRRRATVERRHKSIWLMCQLIPAGARVQGSEVWDFYKDGPSGFDVTHEATLGKFLRAVQEELFAPGEPMSFSGVLTLTSLFSSLELAPVRHCIKPFVDCGLWRALPDAARLSVIAQDEFYARAWTQVERRERPMPDPSNVIAAIVAQLTDLSLRVTVEHVDVAMLVAILELMTVLLRQFPTRRFVEPFVVASGAGAAVGAFEVRAILGGEQTAPLVAQFLDALRLPVDGATGQEMTIDERQRRHAAHVVCLQQACLQFAAPSLAVIAHATVDEIGSPHVFVAMVERVAQAGELPFLLQAARLDSLSVWAADNDPQFSLPWPMVVAAHYQAPETVTGPLEPLLDADALFSGPPDPATSPKPFLTLQDWARHLYALAKLETADELLRQLAEALLRLDVRTDGTTGGWACDAVLLSDKLAPFVGPDAAELLADAAINLEPFPGPVRAEWRTVQPQDRFCVVALAGRDSDAASSGRLPAIATVDAALTNPSALRDSCGIRAVHPAHVVAVVDEDGNVGDAARFSPFKQVLRLSITGSIPEKPLHTVLLRLRPAVTQAMARAADIQKLLDPVHRERFQLPQWCRATILDHDDPSGASMKACAPQTVYLGDTRSGIVYRADEVDSGLWVTEVYDDQSNRRQLKMWELGVPPRRYNSVDFYGGQLDAILAGCARGLSVVNGCNGSGKTIVAAQIVANLYHAPAPFAPSGPTALIASTKAYLGRVLSRVFTLGVRPWHVARPGTNMQLQAAVKERKRLLGLVAQIAAHLEVSGAPAESATAACEFFRSTVQPRWAAFELEAAHAATVQAVWAAYPFPKLEKVEAMGTGRDDEADLALESAERLFNSIAAVFADLETLKVLEELRDPQVQAKALLQRAAKLVMGRSAAEILAVGGERPFSSVIVLGAAQLRVAEVLPAIASASVERICLLGTDQMVRPAVSSRRLWRLGARDSLFGHLRELGVPAVHLFSNYRCEAGPMWQVYGASTADLAYEDAHLEDRQEEMVPAANAGFACAAQAVHVPGLGETRVAPGRIVRVAEADFVVGVFQYMRLIGYEANQVAIVCMTDAQADLVHDEIAARCGQDPNYGWPAAIVTPFTAAGVECKIVLVSLVHTLAVPDVLTDQRVLISALSRASHGAYIFGELALFSERLARELDTAGPTDALYLCGDELADGSVTRHPRNIGLVRWTETWELDDGPPMYKIESAEHMRVHVAQLVAERAGERVGAWACEM